LAFPEIIGFVAGTLITLALVPQVYRLWKLRSAREISLLFTSLNMLGGICWLIYGIANRSPAIIASNVAAFFLVLAMVVAKLRFGSK
jgi:MtN3 and saliva related transmembrane protein